MRDEAISFAMDEMVVGFLICNGQALGKLFMPLGGRLIGTSPLLYAEDANSAQNIGARIG
jgi:hypothetical protein